MHTFFVQNIHKNIAYLDEIDSRHCVKILRLRPGDKVNLIDGKGGLFEGILYSAEPGAVSVNITRIEKDYGKRDYFLHIAIAPTKNLDRFEWFVEKASEIGIDEITPLLCKRSERKNVRNERLEKISVSALKQSMNAYLPVINPVITFNSFIMGCLAKHKYIAHCGDDKKDFLINTINHQKAFTVLIGPEGDFSEEEIESAKNKGFLPVSLGNNRLRTETAGMVTCQIISDWYSLKSG